MLFTVRQNYLFRMLADARRTVPFLERVTLSAEYVGNGRAKLTMTFLDDEMSLSHKFSTECTVRIEVEGACSADVSELADFVGQCKPTEHIDVSLLGSDAGDRQVLVSSGGYGNAIKGERVMLMRD